MNDDQRLAFESITMSCALGRLTVINTIVRRDAIVAASRELASLELQRDELLAALKALEIATDTAWIDDYFGEDCESALEQARAAIASATGDDKSYGEVWHHGCTIFVAHDDRAVFLHEGAGPIWVPTERDPALYFDGVDDYFDLDSAVGVVPQNEYESHPVFKKGD